MDGRASTVQYGHTILTWKKHTNDDGLLRIADTLPACLEYLPTIQLDQLPCRGCKFCTRVRQQWGVFEEEIDDVQPISIRRGLVDTETCNYVDSLSSKEILEEQMHYPFFFGYKITLNQA
jgi:hypothetical protein